MNLRIRGLMQNNMVLEEMLDGLRYYSTKSNRGMKKLRPLAFKLIEEQTKRPVKSMLPVAHDVLKARATLYNGVSALIGHIPVWACKHCPEVYIGEGGHLIRTCRGSRHHAKNKVHTWVKGSTNDIIIPVETFHLEKMSQDVIKYQERFNYDRIPAVVELCLQAGVTSADQSISPNTNNPDGLVGNTVGPELSSDDDLRVLATQTLKAWETLRSGVYKLLLVCPARVCKHCLEVHVGPSGHNARTCGVFKFETWRGTHFWRKAEVDDLVPPKIVWYRRRQDPPILLDTGREYYGHSPAVVDLCSKAGAIVPAKYHYLMKIDGLSAPEPDKSLPISYYS